MVAHAKKAQDLDEKIANRWPVITRKIEYGQVPNGYMVNEENRRELLPDRDQIEILEEAFDYLEAGNSVREVCEWVNQKLKKNIVHQTVSNLYKRHRKPWVRVKTAKPTRPKMDRETKKILSAKAKARFAVKAAEKAVSAAQVKKQQKLRQELEASQQEDMAVLEPIQLSGTKVFPDAPINTQVLFKPNPGPQTAFLSATEEEVLYGGGAGGGKSYAMLMDPMRYFHNPNFVGLLLRRTNDELRELKWESMKIYPKAFPGAVWKEKDSMWVFPSGAKFWMTYLERDEDVMRYQGQSFCWIGFDELTQYATPFAWQYLKSRLRTTDPELKKHLSMRATTNPGGPGHAWVKQMFVDPEVPGKAFWARDLETGEILSYPPGHEREGEPLFKRKFIPALLKDNPYLADDGAYERSLHGLPEAQRRKLLDGDWSVIEGAAFPEFNPKIHVIEPFEIPDHWTRFRSGDFGYGSNSAVLWFAIDPSSETLFVYRELYVSKKTGKELAQMVLNLEIGEKIKYGILDSSVWHQRGNFGPSIAEEMISMGCSWRPSDRGKGSRSAGKNRLHELLKINEWTGEPDIMFFNNCRQVIADLPMLPQDPHGEDDIDSKFKSDHTYDALRYGIMSRPRSGTSLDWGRTPTRTYQPADPRFGY